MEVNTSRIYRRKSTTVEKSKFKIAKSAILNRNLIPKNKKIIIINNFKSLYFRSKYFKENNKI